MKKILFAFLAFVLIENNYTMAQMASCWPPSAKVDLDISNVRATIFNSNDMWWDLASGSAGYEVPKGSGKKSLFLGAFWIGGYERISQNLRVASQMYRQSGSDFWPGPVTVTGTTVDSATCKKYDRLWKINRSDVLNFINTGVTTPDMVSYPGNGDSSLAQAHFLAPFFDKNNDGLYNIVDGDYPYFDYINSSSGGCNECSRLHGDQVIWWVMNDVGNIHKNSQSPNPIGLEIQAQAFAFVTNDSDINNTTFYQYKIINRNTSSILDSTFIGEFVDPDLGNFDDDYVGCDVARGMGYCYNADDIDQDWTTCCDTILGYGINPPAVGVDYIQGPKADIGDGMDNDRDSCMDCTWVRDTSGLLVPIPDTILPERIKMSTFLCSNNDFTPNGNPETYQDYYNYMKGVWRDGKVMTYDHVDGRGAGPNCHFMYPGTTDPYHYGTNGTPVTPWSEDDAPNMPGERRFVMSAGPFTLLPGAVHCVSFTAVWARGNAGRLSSVAKLKTADDKAQMLADSCFRISALVGIHEAILPQASVYPNPVTDLLYINLNKQLKDAAVNIYDVTGKLVKAATHLNGDHFTISCKELSSGIYFFRINAKNEPGMAGKFVKK